MTRWKQSLVLLLLLAERAQALQILDVQDGETALAKIARKEVTRIALEHGRIDKVTGNAGEFVLERDDAKGQVFIRPADPHSAKPINLFISTEQGTLALLLQPVDTPSDTIILKEPRERRPRTRLEISGRHVRTCKEILLALARDALPDDMDIQEPGQAIDLWPNTRVTLERVLTGTAVTGEKYRMTNTGSAELNIAEADLFKAGITAISVEQPHLLPGESTVLFMVKERHGDD